MKKRLKRIMIVFGGGVSVLSVCKILDILMGGGMYQLIQTYDAKIMAGVFIVGAFLSLGLLLGKKHQVVITAFILTTLTLLFCISGIEFVSGAICLLMLFIEGILILYIFLLVCGERLLDAFIEAVAVRDEDGNKVRVESAEGEDVLCIDGEKEKEPGVSFMNGASTVLIMFEIVHLVADLLPSSIAWIISATLILCNLIIALWREPSTEK